MRTRDRYLVEGLLGVLLVIALFKYLHLHKTSDSRGEMLPRKPYHLVLHLSNHNQVQASRIELRRLLNLSGGRSQALNLRVSENSTTAKDSAGFKDVPPAFLVPDPSRSIICHAFTDGRMGNHLFEYASIIGIAEATNKSFYFLNEGLLKDVLKYPPGQTDHEMMRSRCQAATVLKERHGCQFDRRLVSLEPEQDYMIEEYMQSWMYFDAIREEIKTVVTFKDSIVKEAGEVVRSLRLLFPRALLVGVHVRKGDLTSQQRVDEGYLVASPEYFERAMMYFRKRFPHVLFVVVAEPRDTQWCLDKVKASCNDVVVLEPRSVAVDMQILSMMDHMIRTVGTFGWWAAYKIAGRPKVVYLADFVNPDSPLSAWYSPEVPDYMLPGWLPM